MRRLGFDLIILGSPVSGKDTQANMLMNHYELKPVRSGEFFRKLMNNPKYKKVLDNSYGRGFPAPSKLLNEFIAKQVRKAPKTRNLVFVGNPRLKNEAIFLKKLLYKKKRDFFVLYIQVPDKVIIKRSFHRDREKHDLDMTYIRNRIGYHKKQVKETIKYFQKLHKVKFINGNQVPFKVTRDIQKAINDYQRSQRN